MFFPKVIKLLGNSFITFQVDTNFKHIHGTEENEVIWALYHPRAQIGNITALKYLTIY